MNCAPALHTYAQILYCLNLKPDNLRPNMILNKSFTDDGTEHFFIA